MKQPTFSDLEYQGKKSKTRQELFLERVDDLIPRQNRGLAKNTERLVLLFGLGNLLTAEGQPRA